MKYKFPFKCHSGLVPKLSQGFGESSGAAREFYIKYGYPTFHYGIDFYLGNNTQGYGSELINTFTEPTVIRQIWWDTPMATHGNGIAFSNGIYTVKMWHCSEIIKQKGNLAFGETVALMGNSGATLPPATYGQPFNGTHCHLEVWPNATGDRINPLDVFNINDLIYGKDTGFIKDIPPFQWAINGLSLMLQKLKTLLGY